LDGALPEEGEDTGERGSGAPPSTRARTDAEVVESLAPRVRRIAGSLLRNDHDADDAAQVSLMELYRALPSYRGEGSLEAFCDRVVVRTAIRIARARRLSSVRTETGVDPDELSSNPSGRNLAEGLPRTIETYLHELPEARRTALVLRHAMGYSMDEIAALTEVSVNTVKSRLLEAREQVRKMVRRDLATGRRSS